MGITRTLHLIYEETPQLNPHDIIFSGKILASALQLSIKLSQHNVTPLEVDLEVTEFIISCGGTPSFKGIDNYPYATCISVNDQIVHGIPSKKPFKLKDIVTIDIGVSYNSHCTDAARTFVIGGNTNKRNKHMIQSAYDALDDGISQARPDNHVGDISYAIQKHVFNGRYKTTLEYGGHGIGLKPHTNPFIPNYGTRGTGLKLTDGMCLAIEPILIDGSNKVAISEKDGWTIYSPKGYLSAHVEDTIVVNDTPIILTRTTLDGDFV